MERIEIENILKEIKFKNWNFYLGDKGDDFYLQVKFEDFDIHSNKLEMQHGRKWYISKFMISDEIVRTAFMAVMVATEHEIRETFLYKNQNIFGPHLSVDTLVEVAEKRKFRKEE